MFIYDVCVCNIYLWSKVMLLELSPLSQVPGPYRVVQSTCPQFGAIMGNVYTTCTICVALELPTCIDKTYTHRCLMHQKSVYISFHKETLFHAASHGMLLTWQGFGYEGPRQQYFHHCSRRSRPWHQGWSPAHSRLGQKRWARLWYGESERPNPIWSECWLPLQRSKCGHPEAAYRNGYSYPCSEEREKRGTCWETNIFGIMH